MRAGVYTVQAEGAIHVAGFLRLEELQLAAALFFVTAKTIVRLTSSTDIEAAHAYFHRRNERLNELILPNGTNVLTETRSFEEAVNDQRGREITYDQPRRPTRTVPQAKGFIGPEKDE